MNAPSIVPEDSKRRIVAEYGDYVVYYDPLAHVPWGLFRVYHGERYIGAQVSWPSKSDCQWLEHWGHRYASSSFRDDKPYGYGAIKRGAVKRAFTIKRSRIQAEEVEEVT
jgi:hypothetical protein